ncbi:MAG: hypothetical protein JZU65_23005 [Chlorobium sp.]|nr:hypothetical protein [Chlorobium sp.]
MTKLARYLFGIEEAKTISTRTIEGSSWYMAADICRLLRIASHSQAVHKHLTDQEWQPLTIFTGCSRRQVLMVNDSGMLKLIMLGRTDWAMSIQERARQTPDHLNTNL